MIWENGYYIQLIGGNIVYIDGKFKLSGQRYKLVMCGNLIDCLGLGLYYRLENGWRSRRQVQDYYCLRKRLKQCYSLFLIIGFQV